MRTNQSILIGHRFDFLNRLFTDHLIYRMNEYCARANISNLCGTVVVELGIMKRIGRGAYKWISTTPPSVSMAELLLKTEREHIKRLKKEKLENASEFIVEKEPVKEESTTENPKEKIERLCDTLVGMGISLRFPGPSAAVEMIEPGVLVIPYGIADQDLITLLEYQLDTCKTLYWHIRTHYIKNLIKS